MPRAPHSLKCTIETNTCEYEHRGATIEYEIYVDPEETLRQVIGGVKNPDGRRAFGPVSETVRLKPAWYHRVLAWLTSWEWEPLPKHEHVQHVTEELEAFVEHAREVQDRRGDGLRITEVNGEPVEPGETPEIEVQLGGDEDGPE